MVQKHWNPDFKFFSIDCRQLLDESLYFRYEIFESIIIDIRTLRSLLNPNKGRGLNLCAAMIVCSKFLQNLVFLAEISWLLVVKYLTR